MPLTPSPTAARPRRRSVLTGALGATGAAFGLPLVAACTDEEAPGSADAEHTEAARRLHRRAARDSEQLLARYDGTVKVHPALAARLRPLREEVARHVRVLRGSESGTRAPAPAPSASHGSRPPTGSASPSRSGEPDGGPAGGPAGPSERPPSPDTASVPKSEKAALAELAKAERRLAAARTKALESAPAEFARLLASVAACGAAHGYLLGEAGEDGERDAPQGSGESSEGEADG
ncbi:hypothetical protein ITI46_12050 [Streptomyces oryzae]|uniref:Lipoprotein n=1 Tax=Streptomyces oryzae TaxID=1434886 RepID=A0ABS3XAH7_9ACTN|nr:hypothetical protein [Streptomyces oryzae]MBO8192393.1 hypothetical protein [Streptomyces oryzae]